jgi:hypothetical protein
MAAEQFSNSMVAFLFPLFAPSMYQALGYGWGNSILALAGTLVAFPLSIFLWKHGEKLRAKARPTH